MLPFFQAYYDLRSSNGFDSTVSWRDVIAYCKDIGIPDYGEYMFDVLRTAQATVEDKWTTK